MRQSGLSIRNNYLTLGTHCILAGAGVVSDLKLYRTATDPVEIFKVSRKTYTEKHQLQFSETKLIFINLRFNIRKDIRTNKTEKTISKK